MNGRKYEISPETMRSMAKFFMQTSVPRLIEKVREKEKEKTG